MKISNQISSLLGISAFAIGAILFVGCGPKQADGGVDAASHQSSVSGSGYRPSVQEGINDPSILDQFSCSPHGDVSVCHVPGGNPSAQHTICIGRAALKAHLGCGDHSGSEGGSSHPGHGGDHLGNCGGSGGDPQPEPSSTPSFTPPSSA